MKRTYQRSKILAFDELNVQQQEQAIDQLESELANDTNYVLWNDEPLPLCMFERIDKGLFNGHYMLSAFSGYLIRINKTNECATVVYAHW